MAEDLQSVSAWMRTADVPLRLPLAEDRTADVCIVGGGITGLTAAYLLCKEGKSVILLEQGTIGGGETGRTTAHFVTALDDRYFFLERVHGLKRAKLAAESHAAAIDRVEKIIAEEKIACDFVRLPGYLFLPPKSPTDLLEKELKAVHRVGLRDVTLLPHAPLPSFETGACLHFPRQAQLHILRYLAGLSNAMEKRGGKIFTQTHVSHIEEGSPCIIKTSAGFTVSARDVILATNAPIQDNALVYSKQAAYRTFVIAAPVPKGSVPLGLYWDTPPETNALRPVPYHYIRLAPLPGDTDLLIIGGEDHRTGQKNDAPLRFAALERWSRTRFPMMQEVTDRWSGQVMETADGLALIGKKPGGKGHLFIVTGDSGNGMTHGTIAGMIFADTLSGKKNHWSALYDPSRIRPRALKEFVAENACTAVEGAKGWVTRGETRTAEDLPLLSGMITQKGLKKIALYRDGEGELHAFSAICPHRGCIVHFNAFERSFDCPCHGSRFDAEKGKVLSGPSIKDLRPEHLEHLHAEEKNSV